MEIIVQNFKKNKGDTMKKIYNKIKNNILKYTTISSVLFIIINFILYLFDIRFRLWFFFLVSLFIIISFILSVIKISFTKSKFKRTIMLSSLVMTIIFGLINSTILIILFSNRYKPEHTITLNDIKYVAVVSSSKYVDVDYYDYYNPILMGTKVKVHGYFGEGDFDPFINSEINVSGEYTYYDNNGKKVAFNDDEVILDYEEEKGEENLLEISKNIGNIVSKLIEESDFLYEKKFGKTVLRFNKVDNVLGQNIIVKVFKSEDNGENFYPVSDEFIKVSKEARFVFLNDELGFALSTGKISLKDDIECMYVTQDGGKTFEKTTFNFDGDSANYLDINGLPYFEDDKLKLNASVYKNRYEDIDLIFISNDNGIRWNLEDK